MLTHNSSSRRLAVGISLLAGFIDALGYLSLGGVFLSFMSGNSTRFAVMLGATLDWHIVLLPLALIVLFVIGVMIGRAIRHFFTRIPSTAIMGFIAIMLTIGAVINNLGSGYFYSASFLAVAMGAANNIFIRNGEVSIGLTYMTGTLVRLGQRLAGRLLGEKDADWVPYLLLWLGFVGGAFLGGVGYVAYDLNSIWAAVVVAYGLTVICARMEAR